MGHQERRGAFPLLAVSRVLSTLWGPDASCLREVGDGWDAHLTRKEATDLDVVKGGLVGDIIEQQQCWGQKASEDACNSLPSTHNLVYHPPSLGLGPSAQELTMSITIVGMGDTAEPLLASRVPDLQ